MIRLRFTLFFLFLLGPIPSGLCQVTVKKTVGADGSVTWEKTINNKNSSTKKDQEEFLTGQEDTKPTTPNEKKRAKRSLIALSLYSGNVKITATETATKSVAEVVSKNGSGADMVWLQLWGRRKRLYSMVVLSYKQFQFRSPINFDLDKDEVSQTYMGVGVGYTFYKRHKLGVNIGQGQSLLLITTNNSSEARIDPVYLTSLNLSGQHKFAHFGNLAANLNWRYGTLLPGKGDSIETQSGSFYYYGLGINYVFGSTSLFGGIGSTQRSLTTDLTTQESSEISVGLGLGFSF